MHAIKRTTEAGNSDIARAAPELTASGREAFPATTPATWVADARGRLRLAQETHVEGQAAEPVVPRTADTIDKRPRRRRRVTAAIEGDDRAPGAVGP
jgi:hypothetical protein